MNDKDTMKELTTKKTQEDEQNHGYLIQRVARLGQSSVVDVMLKI